MKEDLVSVIMPTYNSEKFIKKAIDSVINQTYKKWELIIVDDNSSDNTEIIVKEYCDKYCNIMYIKSEVNNGAAISRNIAIEKSSGRYLAFLDSDDVWFSNKLERQLNFMKNNDCVISYTSYEVINDINGEVIKKVIVPSTLNYHQYLSNTIIQTVTVIVDRKKVPDIRMPNIRTRQDFATWLSILKRGYIAYGMNEVLGQYRWTKNSLSSNKLKAAKRNWYVYRKIENLNIFYASYVFICYSTNAVRKRLLKGDFR